MNDPVWFYMEIKTIFGEWYYMPCYKKKAIWSVICLILLFILSSTCIAAISNAKPIEVNSTYIDNLQTRNTRAYYSFTVPSDGFIKIDFEHDNLTSGERGWDIALYNADSQQLEYFYSRWNQPKVSSANIGLKQGQYYIKIYVNTSFGKHNNANYYLTVNYTESDYWEKEPNDTILTASQVDLNQPYKGSFRITSRNISDVDYYVFQLKEDGYVNIIFEHENLTDKKTGWRLMLLDEQSTELDYFTSALNQTKTNSTNVGLPKGIYYVKVYRQMLDEYSNANYTLTVNYMESDYWEKEPNDKILTATQVDLNQPYRGSTRITSRNINDLDYYVFQLEEDSYIKMVFEHENLSENQIGWEIKLLDYDSETIESFNSYMNQTLTNSDDVGLSAGNYYVLVKPKQRQNIVDYTLTIKTLNLARTVEETTTEDLVQANDETHNLDNELDVVANEEPVEETNPGGFFEANIIPIIVVGAALAIIMALVIMIIKPKNS